jgi:GPH family glycoside/pentoside/hexuronide:cation symporter
VIVRQSFSANLQELWETMHNRGFVVLMLAGICAYTNQGISYALSTYFYNYVWQFAPWALGLLPLALLTGATAAFLIAPRVGKRTSKPRAAFWFVIAGAVVQTMPFLLRLLGILPPPSNPSLLPILFAMFAISTTLNVSAFILGASMMADVVEDSQTRTGRRNEGVFFAGSFFVQKCTSGIGIAGAGVILILAHFPKTAKAGTVPIATLDRLTLFFIIVYGVLAICAALLFTRFPFGRTEHDARLARLAKSTEN